MKLSLRSTNVMLVAKSIVFNFERSVNFDNFFNFNQVSIHFNSHATGLWMSRSPWATLLALSWAPLREVWVWSFLK